MGGSAITVLSLMECLEGTTLAVGTCIMHAHSKITIIKNLQDKVGIRYATNTFMFFCLPQVAE